MVVVVIIVVVVVVVVIGVVVVSVRESNSWSSRKSENCFVSPRTKKLDN